MSGVATPLPPPAPTERPVGSPDVAEPAVARPGTLSSGWRLVTVVASLAALLAWSAVWSASVQLGLSTWWLGPRAEPTPVPVRLLPYALPVIVVLAALNGVRRVPWLGLAAAAVFAGYGVGDLNRVGRLAAVELVVAGATALVSLASLSGVYRRPPGGDSPTPQ